MGCFNKSNLRLGPIPGWRVFAGMSSHLQFCQCVNLLVNKVAVLVSHVKSTNALCEHRREWLVTNLPDS